MSTTDAFDHARQAAPFDLRILYHPLVMIAEAKKLLDSEALTEGEFAEIKAGQVPAAANATATMAVGSGQAESKMSSARGTLIGSIVSLVVAVLGASLLIAGLATPVVKYTECAWVDYGPYYVCASKTPLLYAFARDGTCNSTASRGQAAMALAIIGAIMCAVSIAVSIAAMCTRNRKLPVVSAALLAATTLCATIAMAIDISFFTVGFCDFKPASASPMMIDKKIGASPILMAVAFVVLLLGTIGTLATHVWLQRRAKNAEGHAVSGAGSYGTVDASHSSVAAAPSPSCACDLFLGASVATLLIGALAISLLIAGVATPVMTAKACDSWGYCVEVKFTLTEITSDSSCTKAVNMANTVMAFGIIGAIVCATSSVVTVVAMCMRNRKLLVVSAVLLVAAAGCAMIAMAIDISLFTQSVCDGRPSVSSAGGKLGTSPILMSVAFVVLVLGSIGCIVASMIVVRRGNATDAAASPVGTLNSATQPLLPQHSESDTSLATIPDQGTTVV